MAFCQESWLISAYSPKYRELCLMDVFCLLVRRLQIRVLELVVGDIVARHGKSYVWRSGYNSYSEGTKK